MNKKTYIDSMNMLPFSDDFDEKTIEKMREAAGKATAWLEQMDGDLAFVFGTERSG